MKELTEEDIKEIVLAFFYYWYNAPGTNTDQGFDKWWEFNKHKYV